MAENLLLSNKKAIIQHLRFPFSFLLLPVFIYALVCNPSIVSNSNIWLLFFILHFLVYPSSNAFNSLQDNDQGSIGIIEKPLPVPASMQAFTIGLDILACMLALYINVSTCLLLLAYIIASRLYSWRKVRLKKMPIIGFLTVFIFQGAIVFLIVNSVSAFFEIDMYAIKNALACSFLIGSGYPLSQIYQHTQDELDGVQTISMKLGYKGTFVFSGLLFALGAVLFLLEFKNHSAQLIVYIMSSLIVGAYFTYWFLKVNQATHHANFKNTMHMNLLSCIVYNTCFIIILIFRLFH